MCVHRLPGEKMVPEIIGEKVKLMEIVHEWFQEQNSLTVDLASKFPFVRWTGQKVQPVKVTPHNIQYLKYLLLKVLVPDTTVHLQMSCFSNPCFYKQF